MVSLVSGGARIQNPERERERERGTDCLSAMLLTVKSIKTKIQSGTLGLYVLEFGDNKVST